MPWYRFNAFDNSLNNQPVYVNLPRPNDDKTEMIDVIRRPVANDIGVIGHPRQELSAWTQVNTSRLDRGT